MTKIWTLRSGSAELLKYLSYLLIGVLALMAFVLTVEVVRDFQGLAYVPDKFGVSYAEFYTGYGSGALVCFATSIFFRWLHFALLGNEEKKFLWLIVFLMSVIVGFAIILLIPLLLM